MAQCGLACPAQVKQLALRVSHALGGANAYDDQPGAYDEYMRQVGRALRLRALRSAAKECDAARWTKRSFA